LRAHLNCVFSKVVSVYQDQPRKSSEIFAGLHLDSITVLPFANDSSSGVCENHCLHLHPLNRPQGVRHFH
jgi:hypothetical protein